MTAYIIAAIVIFTLGLVNNLRSGEPVGAFVALAMIALGAYLLA